MQTRVTTSSLVAFVAVLALSYIDAPSVDAQPRKQVDRYDDAFRKYTKRSFGPAFDWRVFKAQGVAESNLDSGARSYVGARGVMQLMPITFREITSKNPELQHIDDPSMNIAAGIAYDRRLWLRWERDSIQGDRTRFMLASYNAGRTTLLHAQQHARNAKLDPRLWPSIERIAPQVPRWRHAETLQYVRRISTILDQLDDRGRATVDGASTRGVKR